MGTIVTLTTDFGLTDAYVAAMKGVILGINPQANVVDICHSTRPQDIARVAFVLGAAYRFFPSRTVHVAVVDPGVGTARRAIILRTSFADFVAPDNGVLSYVIRGESKKPAPDFSSGRVELGPEMQAVAITKSRFWRSPVCPTFHGRDIFAPVAARLSLGMSPLEFGEAVSSVTVLSLSFPGREGDTLTGEIINVDSFGNLLTNIREDDLVVGKQLAVEIGGRTISGLSRTYADGKGLVALIGSSGYLEVALSGGSAQESLDAQVGDTVIVTYRDEFLRK